MLPLLDVFGLNGNKTHIFKIIVFLKLSKDYDTTFLTKDFHRLSGLENELCSWNHKSICYLSRPGTQETELD